MIEWIDINEKLPLVNKTILIALKEGPYTKSFTVSGEFESKLYGFTSYDNWNGSLKQIKFENVSHWAEMPQPPKL